VFATTRCHGRANCCSVPPGEDRPRQPLAGKRGSIAAGGFKPSYPFGWRDRDEAEIGHSCRRQIVLVDVDGVTVPMKTRLEDSDAGVLGDQVAPQGLESRRARWGSTVWPELLASVSQRRCRV
jgi:hypothetical protein